MLRSWARWFPWLFFSGITALIVYPWFFQPGYLFLLDFVWTPQVPSPIETLHHGIITSTPYQWLFWQLGRIIPASFIEKVSLTLPLTCAGVAMFHLMQWILRSYRSPSLFFIPTIAGIFYMLNSFVVTRIYLGHYYLLVAYALTPWVVLWFLSLLHTPRLWSAFAAGLGAAWMMLTSPHHVFLLPFLLVPLLITVRSFKIFSWRIVATFVALPSLVVIAALITYFITPPALQSTVSPTDAYVRLLRAPVTGNLVLDSLFLTASWKLDLPLSYPYETTPFFNAIAVIFLSCMLLAVLGEHTTTHKRLSRALIVIGGIGIILAMGLAHPITRPLTQGFHAFVPFWGMMRDSGKFLALVAFSESVLLGLGIEKCLQFIATVRHRAAIKSSLIASLVVTMILFIRPTFSAFAGQILPHPYPPSWQEWNQRLAMESPKPTMLFLPWHMYMPFSFSDDRTVVNPAPQFFTNARVLSSRDGEVGRPAIQAITDSVLTEWLSKKKIYYVALAIDTFDANKYDYLYAHPRLTLVFQSPELVVWQTKTPAH